MVVLFWCLHASSSDEVEKEYQYALTEKKEIIPVLLDDTPLPDSVAKFQWIDCRSLAVQNHTLPEPNQFQESNSEEKASYDTTVEYNQNQPIKSIKPTKHIKSIEPTKPTTTFLTHYAKYISLIIIEVIGVLIIKAIINVFEGSILANLLYLLKILAMIIGSLLVLAIIAFIAIVLKDVFSVPNDKKSQEKVESTEEKIASLIDAEILERLGYSRFDESQDKY